MVKSASNVKRKEKIVITQKLRNGIKEGLNADIFHFTVV